MGRFHYRAVSAQGELLEGEIEGPSRDAVIERLQDLGHTPLHTAELGAASAAKPARVARPPRRAGARRGGRIHLGRFTRDLATLLRAGVPLERALRMLQELASAPAAAALVGRLLEAVRGGATLSGALEAHPRVFSRFYVSMVRAGEAGGNLDTVLGRLAGFIEEFNQLRASVKSSLIYPLILIVVAALSVIVLVTFVVPQFSALFADMGQDLPLATRLVVGAGEVVRDWGWAVLVVAAVGVWALRRWLADPEVRARWDRGVLGLPGIGDLIVRIEVAVFARTLGTLLGNGVPLLAALAIVRETHTNQALAEAVGAMANGVQQGQGLAEPMARTGRFPPLAVHLVQVGEETGQLESTLAQLADVYDGEVRATIERLLALVEPVLIIGLGLIVGGIIMSILVAILGVNELAF
jgi:general secretion pathway protein F